MTQPAWIILSQPGATETLHLKVGANGLRWIKSAERATHFARQSDANDFFKFWNLDARRFRVAPFLPEKAA